MNYQLGDYNGWKTLIKALLTAFGAALAQEFALRMASGELTDLAMASDWENLGIAVAFGFWKAATNVWKTRHLYFSPVDKLKAFLPLMVLVLTLPGCVTATPAFGGKTTYKMDFVDATADQNTEFHVDISAPAGVEVEGLASMAYRWHPDGSGNIAVAGDTAADTTAQAAMLQEVNAQQVQAFVALLAIIPTLAPLLQALSPAPVAVPAP